MKKLFSKTPNSFNMYRFYTSLLICFCLLLQAAITNAQTTPETSTRGWYTFGLNGGLPFQQSDVRPLILGGGGGGFSLAKNLYYRPNAIFSFDLRGRLQFTRTFGFDAQRTYKLQNNDALNGAQDWNYKVYPMALNEPKGFAFLNYRSDMAELGIEGVLNFNRLLEKKKVILNLYGGLGINWFNTKVNAANETNKTDYKIGFASIDTAKSKLEIIQKIRETVLDNTFETRADGITSALGKVTFTPSAGVEVGYQFSPYFGATIGHKATWSGSNILDGQQWKNTTNDLQHYTSLAFYWKFRGDEKRVLPPTITIISPEKNPYNNASLEGLLIAKIENVDNTADISCTLNNSPINYNYYDRRLTASIPLKMGKNEVEIRAKNAAGIDRKVVVFYYEQPPQVPNNKPYDPRIPRTEPPVPTTETAKKPTVRIIDPSGNYATVREATMPFKAAIQQVTDQRAISLTINNIPVNDFYYNNEKNEIRTNLNLKEGKNTIVLTARNTAGEAREEKVFYYQRPITNAPMVRIIQPRNLYETENLSESLSATVEYVENSNEIRLEVNGVRDNQFQFDAARGTLRSNIRLQEGKNTVVIRARNTVGESVDEITVIRRQAYRPTLYPEVRIKYPSYSTTQDANMLIGAAVKNVERKSDIRILLNNREIYDFSLSNNYISANATLQEGNNTLLVIVRNGDGKQEDSKNIRYTIPAPKVEPEPKVEPAPRPSPRPRPGREIEIEIGDRRNEPQKEENTTPSTNNLQPKVNFLSPRAQYSVSKNSTMDVRAVAQHINDNDNIQVVVNGQVLRGFAFDGGTGRIQATVSLQSGDNNVTIKVSNAAGNAEVQRTIKYEAPRETPKTERESPRSNELETDAKPVINIRSVSQPTSNPMKPTALYVSIVVKLENITSKDQIECSFNGANIGDFEWNANTKTLVAVVNAQKGNNEFIIKAKNSGGETSATKNFEL
jgi:hypothetical protein